MSIVEEWREVESTVGDKGSRYCSGGIIPPSLEIHSQATKHPYDAATIGTIQTVAQPAPFGLGSKTLVDETVRKGLQIEPDLVKFCNPESWNRRLDAITQELRNAFQRTNITLQFYKMLLYEQGGHFASHKDTLRDKTHIASLLISLPVEGGCEGGVLRVSGPGVSKEVMEWDGRCDDLEASWCSFYTDCQHELTVLTAGRRVVLAYEVYAAEVIAIDDDDDDDDESPNSSDFSRSEDLPTDEKKDNALILLKHMYAPGCKPKHMKGFDRVVYEILYCHYKENYKVQVVLLDVSISRSNYYEGDQDIDNFFCGLEKTEGNNRVSGQKNDESPLEDLQLCDIDNKKDPITFPAPLVGSKRGAAAVDDDDNAHEYGKKVKIETEMTEHGDGNGKEVEEEEEESEKFLTYFIKHQKFAFLFNTDDIEKRPSYSYDEANDHVGNQPAPDNAQYRLYALALCKKIKKN